jgi:uncharacterized membrane protein
MTFTFSLFLVFLVLLNKKIDKVPGWLVIAVVVLMCVSFCIGASLDANARYQQRDERGQL